MAEKKTPGKAKPQPADELSTATEPPATDVEPSPADVEPAAADVEPTGAEAEAAPKKPSRTPKAKPAKTVDAAASTEPPASETTGPPATAATTEVIHPVSAPGTDTAAQRTVVIDAPPRKRRRWPWILLIVLVVLAALLVAAFFIAERYVREYAENYTREQIVSVLSLPEDTPVHVTLGEGSIILQALSGAIREVDVSAQGVTFGQLTGDAEISATHVPLDGTQPVETLDIAVTIDEENVRSLAGSLSGLELDSIELQDGVIAIGTEFNIFNFIVVPVGVDLAPAAKDGAITFDPVTIYLGDDPISVADLRNSREFSALAGDLLRTQTVCVADSLPEALTVVDVQVVRTDLVVRVNGDGTALSGPGLSTVGTCPE